jgi:hypothetical protein
MRPSALRRIAIHESGHHRVLSVFGVEAWSRVWEDEHGVICGVTYTSNTEGCPQNYRCLLGCAGLLAEFLAFTRPNADADLAFSWLGLKIASDTDAAHMANMTVLDVEMALELLRAAWPQVLTTADKLIENSFSLIP